MDFATSSDPVLRFAFWSGVAAAGVTLLLVFQLILLRAMLNYRERRKSRFLAIWRPLIVQSIAGGIQNYPQVHRADIAILLNLWNHFQESLRGDAKEHLGRMAREVSIDKMALNMLVHRGLSNQLLAMMTLGNLRKQSAWQALLAKLEHDNPVISLAAARSLMQIDAAAAVEVMMPKLLLREDWSAARVASIFQEAGADVISLPLARLIRNAPQEKLPRLIPFLVLAYAGVSSAVVQEYLTASADPQVIVACLRVMSDARDLPLARQYLRHPDWPVRVQAAAVLGRMGVVEDVGELVHLLADPQWWVRYRAAQALSHMPFVTTAQLEQIFADQQDRYARDMLKQVLAERLA